MQLLFAFKTGYICWVNGSYECGKRNDIMIFRDSLMLELDESERVEVDDSYVEGTPRHVKYSKHFTEDDKCVLANKEWTRNSKQQV